MCRASRLCLVILGVLGPAAVFAQTAEPLLVRAQQERQAYLDTLRELVSIESGSGDVEGLGRIADLIAARLRARRALWRERAGPGAQPGAGQG